MEGPPIPPPLIMLLVLFVAGCPVSSEAGITRADCDEFVHRIFNMVRAGGCNNSFLNGTEFSSCSKKSV